MDQAPKQACGMSMWFPRVMPDDVGRPYREYLDPSRRPYPLASHGPLTVPRGDIDRSRCTPYGKRQGKETARDATRLISWTFPSLASFDWLVMARWPDVG